MGNEPYVGVGPPLIVLAGVAATPTAAGAATLAADGVSTANLTVNAQSPAGVAIPGRTVQWTVLDGDILITAGNPAVLPAAATVRAGIAGWQLPRARPGHGLPQPPRRHADPGGSGEADRHGRSAVSRCRRARPDHDGDDYRRACRPPGELVGRRHLGGPRGNGRPGARGPRRRDVDGRDPTGGIHRDGDGHRDRFDPGAAQASERTVPLAIMSSREGKVDLVSISLELQVASGFRVIEAEPLLAGGPVEVEFFIDNAGARALHLFVNGDRARQRPGSFSFVATMAGVTLPDPYKDVAWEGGPATVVSGRADQGLSTDACR